MGEIVKLLQNLCISSVFSKNYFDNFQAKCQEKNQNKHTQENNENNILNYTNICKTYLKSHHCFGVLECNSIKHLIMRKTKENTKIFNQQ